MMDRCRAEETSFSCRVDSMKYQEPFRFDQEQTHRILANGSIGERCELIASMALNDDEPVAAGVLAALCDDDGAGLH